MWLIIISCPLLQCKDQLKSIQEARTEQYREFAMIRDTGSVWELPITQTPNTMVTASPGRPGGISGANSGGGGAGAGAGAGAAEGGGGGGKTSGASGAASKGPKPVGRRPVRLSDSQAQDMSIGKAKWSVLRRKLHLKNMVGPDTRKCTVRTGTTSVTPAGRSWWFDAHTE